MAKITLEVILARCAVLHTDHCTRASTRHLLLPARPACRWMPRCSAAMRSTSCWQGCGCMQRSMTASTGRAASAMLLQTHNMPVALWCRLLHHVQHSQQCRFFWPCRVQCSACSKWRILGFDAMQAVSADTVWTCSQLGCTSCKLQCCTGSGRSHTCMTCLHAAL